MLFLLIETKLDAYVVPVRSGRLYPLERKDSNTSTQKRLGYLDRRLVSYKLNKHTSIAAFMVI
jgi:hypothetical protein